LPRNGVAFGNEGARLLDGDRGAIHIAEFIGPIFFQDRPDAI